ncbi:YncE family protein [Bacteroidota bacterium]
MNNTKACCVYFLISLFASCTEEYGPQYTNLNNSPIRQGVFILNEGNFNSSNGSISFYNTEQRKVYHHVYFSANERSVGDVVNSMEIIDTLGFIVINNSAKIEVVGINSIKSIATIIGFKSPRHLKRVSFSKAFVSDLYADKLFIIDLDSLAVTGTIEIGYSSENILVYENLVFVTFWSNYKFPDQSNDTILVIDANSDKIISKIKVGIEPNSLVIDKHENVWILCSGGYNHSIQPELYKFNIEKLRIEHNYQFENKASSPTRLTINKEKDTLLFLNKHVYRMLIKDDSLPDKPIIKNEKGYFYSLGQNPGNSEIYVSDALNYQDNGTVFRYSPKGALIDSFKAGIIPTAFVFK